MAARELARRGVSVLVFEEDRTIGRPERCAGLYSISGLKSLGLPLDGPYVQNTVRGATFISPSGHSFVVEAADDVAVVCNRERFDQYIAETVLDVGGCLRLGERVRSIRKLDGGFGVEAGDGLYSAAYLIVAEGRRAHIARQVHPRYGLGRWTPIIQYQVAGHGMNPSHVYLFFTHYLPDFFAYLVPVDERIGKVGVAAMRDTWGAGRKFLHQYFPKSRVVGVSSSSIYVGPPLDEPMWDGAFLVGDVAGQVKSTTGGGVIYGGLCAIAAARHIAGEGEFGRLASPLLTELRRTYLLRRLVSRLDARTLDILFHAVSESGLDARIGEVGDMERHLPTIARSLLHMRGLSFITHLLKTYLVDGAARLKS